MCTEYLEWKLMTTYNELNPHATHSLQPHIAKSSYVICNIHICSFLWVYATLPLRLDGCSTMFTVSARFKFVERVVGILPFSNFAWSLPLSGGKSHSVFLSNAAIESKSASSTCLFIPLPLIPSFHPLRCTTFSVTSMHMLNPLRKYFLTAPLRMALFKAGSSPWKICAKYTSHGLPCPTCSLYFSLYVRKSWLGIYDQYEHVVMNLHVKSFTHSTTHLQVVLKFLNIVKL